MCDALPSQYAAIIPLTPGGEILLQHRDNDPQVTDAGKLSLFAGALEEGETKEQAGRREFLEETTIDYPNLIYLFTYITTVKRHGRIAENHVFLATDIDEAKVDVQEGQGYKKIATPQDLGKYAIALVSKDILEEYFAEYAGNIPQK